MASRTDTVAAALRHPKLLRPVLAHELRGAVVQGFGPGSSEARWTATVPQLAEAIDTALTEAEEKDIPAGSNTVGSQGTAFTPHALVLEPDGLDFRAVCRCGRPIGRTPQGRSLDGLVGLWEQHSAEADPDSTWARAVACLPASSIGAS